MQREAAGRRELRVELPAGAVVEDAWAAAVREVPALAPGRSSVRFAVNGDYADPTRSLADGDELACIPPVSGGSGETGTGSEPAGPRPILALPGEPFPGPPPAPAGSSSSVPSLSRAPSRPSSPTASRPTRTAAS